MKKTIWEIALEQMSFEELKKRRSVAVGLLKNAKTREGKDGYEQSVNLINKVINSKQQLLLNFDEGDEANK